MPIPDYGYFVAAAATVLVLVAILRSRSKPVTDDQEAEPPATGPAPSRDTVRSVPNLPAPPGRVIEASLGGEHGSAHFALVPGLGIVGPCSSKQQAEGFLKAKLELQQKYALPVDDQVAPSLCIIRRDLSAPPFYVWEFKLSNGGSAFVVKGPDGWELPMVASATMAQGLAVRRRTEHLTRGADSSYTWRR